jgi:hypothetical protein
MFTAKKIAACLPVICLLLFSIHATGDPVSLPGAETDINRLFVQMASLRNDSLKKKVNDSIVLLMNQTLQLAGSFDYPFSRLTKMGKITSSDGKVRIYTWNLPWADGTNAYFGFLQYKTARQGEIRLTFLNDRHSAISRPEHSTLKPDQWFGMLVYEIVPVKSGPSLYYTLLGLDNENLFISRKIIDVLYFSDQGEPWFGKDIFHYQNTLCSRVSFPYSSRVKMTLTWNPKLKMIVFDHLSPDNPSHSGNFTFYGPDFTYGGMRFENGQWEEVQHVDVRNSNK